MQVIADAKSVFLRQSPISLYVTPPYLFERDGAVRYLRTA